MEPKLHASVYNRGEKNTSEMNNDSAVEYWFVVCCFFVFYLFPKINSDEQEKFSKCYLGILLL